MSEVTEERDGCEPVMLPDTSSLLTTWDAEDSSIARLHLDNGTQELQDIVEDKEIAARAVAFVVNSTRKGIVPLCADVATLLRRKRELEMNLLALKQENASLRTSVSGSILTSQSTSPPHSIASYNDHVGMGQDRTYSRSSSRSSSLISNSPRPERVRHQRSPRLHRTSAFTVHESGNRPNVNVTTATVHRSNNGLSNETLGLPSSKGGHERKGSLPEIVSVPQGHITKVSPRAKRVSKGTQCVLEGEVSESSRSSHCSDGLSGSAGNLPLAAQLSASKREVADLKAKLKTVEMHYLARKFIGRFHIENECLPPVSTLPEPHPARRNRHPSLTSSGPVVQAVPMRGCRCSRCDEIIRSDVEWDELEARSDSATTLYRIGDHVVIDEECTGHVQYIGHLDNVGNTNFVFIGIELDAPVGHHDGSLNGRRYFSCQENHGIIIPIQDILGVVFEEKPVRKKSSCMTLPSCSRPPNLQRSMSQEPVSPVTGSRTGSLPRSHREGRRYSHSQEMLSSTSRPFTHVLARSPSDSCKLAPNSTKYPARVYKEKSSERMAVLEKRRSSSDAGHHKMTEKRYPSGDLGNLKLPRHGASGGDLV